MPEEGISAPSLLNTNLPLTGRFGEVLVEQVIRGHRSGYARSRWKRDTTARPRQDVVGLRLGKLEWPPTVSQIDYAYVAFQRTPLRIKNERKSSRSFKDGSDFLRTIAPNQQVTKSDASFWGSCAVGAPLSI